MTGVGPVVRFVRPAGREKTVLAVGSYNYTSREQKAAPDQPRGVIERRGTTIQET